MTGCGATPHEKGNGAHKCVNFGSTCQLNCKDSLEGSSSWSLLGMGKETWLCYSAIAMLLVCKLSQRKNECDGNNELNVKHAMQAILSNLMEHLGEIYIV